MKRNRSFAWVVFGFALAFMAGFVFNVVMVPSAVAQGDARQEATAKFKEMEEKIKELEERMEGITIKFGEQVTGPDWGCGGESTKDAPYVMVGSKDGTGCGVANRNYFRRLEIEVPR